MPSAERYIRQASGTKGIRTRTGKIVQFEMIRECANRPLKISAKYSHIVPVRETVTPVVVVSVLERQVGSISLAPGRSKHEATK